MSSFVSILQTAFVLAQQAAQQPAAPQKTSPAGSDFWQLVSDLHVVEALTFISFGVVCLFYGWRIFKILVTICLRIGRPDRGRQGEHVHQGQCGLGGDFLCRRLRRLLLSADALGRQSARVALRRNPHGRGDSWPSACTIRGCSWPAVWSGSWPEG